MSDTKRERRLFETRAAWQSATAASALPPFAAVLAQVRLERRERTQARWLAFLPRSAWHAVFGLAAAAAAVGTLFVATREAPSPAVVAEPPASFACYDEPQSLVVEAMAYATDRAVATAEDHYAACLVATPRSAPAGGMCAPRADTDVTCGSGGPLDGEVFESKIRGGSLQ